MVQVTQHVSEAAAEVQHRAVKCSTAVGSCATVELQTDRQAACHDQNSVCKFALSNTANSLHSAHDVLPTDKFSK